MKLVLTLITLSILFFNVCQSQEADRNSKESLTLSGPYLGQKPPGTTPELFAPGIISREDYFEHSAAIFSPDMREVYWCAKRDGDRYFKMYFMKIIDGTWTAPQVVPFLEINYSEKGPVFSPDGNELYFDLHSDIWVVKRQGDGWSEPSLVSEASDSTRYENIIGITESGSIYFRRTQFNPRIDEICVVEKSGEEYSEPRKLGRNFQSGHEAIGGVFVAPDESYMILELRPDNRTSGLFVSYRTADDSWSPEISLSLGWGLYPSVSPDGKYIFFIKRDGIYWVSTSILEDLKPAEPNK